VRGEDAPRRVIRKDWAPAFAGEKPSRSFQCRILSAWVSGMADRSQPFLYTLRSQKHPGAGILARVCRDFCDFPRSLRPLN